MSRPIKATKDKAIKIAITLKPIIHETLYKEYQRTGQSISSQINQALLHYWLVKNIEGGIDRQTI